MLSRQFLDAVPRLLHQHFEHHIARLLFVRVAKGVEPMLLLAIEDVEPLVDLLIGQVAFSRDQAEKIYVQTRMLEHARELFAWLEDGGGFYVCGDASRMAKDVDAALHQVIQTAGAKSAEEATAYVAALKKDKRYQRDVY